MLKFFKYQGSGNDFVVIDNREKIFPLSCITRICHRKYGIGADGVVLLELPCSPHADFRMHYYNADGRKAEMCGNGLRCLVHFIHNLSFEVRVHVSMIPGQHYRIETDVGILSGIWKGNSIAMEMPTPRYLQRHLDISVHEKIWKCNWIDTGVPHLMIEVFNIHEIDLLHLGPIFRSHPLFRPQGTNVSWMSVDALHNRISLRTYERGVECETLACGTAAIAAAFLGMESHGLSSPMEVLPVSGEPFIISLEAGRSAWVEGPAHCVFQGEIHI